MDGVTLYFGWRVAILGFAAIQMLALAVALTLPAPNHLSNRLLAAVLVVLAGLLTPYVIGFAGAYDAWRWLTFAPFAITLALPPLLYGYTSALVQGRRPERFGLHLTPGAVQLVYFLVAFTLPLDAKWSWYTSGHRHWIGPAFDVLLLVSLAVYSVAALRLLRAYRATLADQRSDGDRFAARWLSRVIVALIVTFLLYLAFTLWDRLSGGIDFFQETGLYLALAGIGLYLGVEGWRHSTQRFPVLTAPTRDDARSSPDWPSIGQDFDARLRAGGWASEPDLSLPGVARRLATNTGRVSRAINLGLGLNFAAWINGVRAEAVAAALNGGSAEDLLTLAFDAGFSSKASFNRAFQARFGVAPSRYRRRVSDHDFRPSEPEMRREPNGSPSGSAGRF
ncbi:helix-turn-helix domain-containing protein [Brevundimonas sp. TWP2-3-2]|uniref:AraC family transcriptional regulator n=1 Tax=unclassified Brevundimonas TaxID=2622653 RepID=UPI003CFA7B0E